MGFLDAAFLTGTAEDGVDAGDRVGVLRTTFFAGLDLGAALLVFVLTAVFFSAAAATGATGATGTDADARAGADGAAWAGVGAVAGFTSAILVFGSEA